MIVTTTYLEQFDASDLTPAREPARAELIVRVDELAPRFLAATCDIDVAVPGPMSLVAEGLCIGIAVLVFSSRAIALVAL